jgi:phospholipid/cholesterol/gamma-HCH transport system permease protein
MGGVLACVSSARGKLLHTFTSTGEFTISSVKHKASFGASAPRDGAAQWTVSGSLTAQSVPAAWLAIDKLLEDATVRSAQLDASALTYCDVSGAAVILSLQQRLADRGGKLDLVGLPQNLQPILALFEPKDVLVAKTTAEPVHLPEQTGRAVMSVWDDICSQIEFLGEACKALFLSLLAPHTIRWRDALLHMEKVGVNAIPIGSLVGFLVGLIIALTATIPMKQFGAEIFVANLVGISMIRELGPLMGAILLAGRSGSAFAAEIGTMKVNDEVSALNTMGLDPMRFLVVPRLIAGIAMMPFLTILLTTASIIGGAVVFLVWIGYPLTVYIAQLQQQVVMMDIFTGLIKAFTFGIIVSGVGCMRGLQTKTGASAVGESTTSAVVTTIVLIVIASGIFTYLFAVLGI